jgi:phage-related protein
MATTVGEAELEVVPKVDPDKFAKDASAPLGKAFGKIGASLAGLGLAAGAISIGKGALEAAQESAQIAAQTEAVVKSTGGAAKLTAAQIGDMSEALSKKNAVDDEAIQQGQNLLLTFTNVKNEVGEGNDIFTQSSQTMIDMAAAMGTDVKGGAIQLGKALNDPTQGIAALTRVGVTFTDQQKDQIKTMQEAGDTVGAQKVILAELSKEFGGSAEAQATAGKRMSIAFGNLQEDLGAKLIPVFEKFSTWMVDVGIPAVEKFMAVAVPAIQEAIAWIQQNVVPVVQQAVGIIAALIGDLVTWTRAHWEEISGTVEMVLADITAIIEAAVTVITFIWENFGDLILERVQFTFEFIAATIKNAMEVIQGVIKVVTALIHGDWGLAWEGIKQIIDGIWKEIGALITFAINEIKNTIDLVLRALGLIMAAAWGAIKDAAADIWGSIVDTVTGAIGDIGSAIAGLPGLLTGIIFDLAIAAANVGGAIVDGFLSGLGKMVGEAGDFASAVGNALIDVVNTHIIDKINDLLEFTVKGPGFLPDVHVDPPDIKQIPHFASGGFTDWPDNEARLAMLHGGERIFNDAQWSAFTNMLAAAVSGGGGPSVTIGQVVIENLTSDNVDDTADQFAQSLALAFRHYVPDVRAAISFGGAAR